MADVDVRYRTKSIDYLYELAKDEETKVRLENFLTQLFRELRLNHISFFHFLNRRITISPKEVGIYMNDLFSTMDLTLCLYAPSTFYFCEQLYKKTTCKETIRRLNVFMTELFGQLLKKRSMLFEFINSNILKSENQLQTFFQDLFSPLKMGPALPLPYVRLKRLNMNNFIPRVFNESGEVKGVFHPRTVEQREVADNTLREDNCSFNKHNNPCGSCTKKNEEPQTESAVSLQINLKSHKTPSANHYKKFKLETGITLNTNSHSVEVVKSTVTKTYITEKCREADRMNICSSVKPAVKSMVNPKINNMGIKEEIVSAVSEDTFQFPVFKIVKKTNVKICGRRINEKRETGKLPDRSMLIPLFRKVPKPVSSQRAEGKEKNPGIMDDGARDSLRKMPVFRIVPNSRITKPASKT